MNILSKILNLVKRRQRDIFLGFCLVLISVIAFNLGRNNALNKTSPETDEKAGIYQPVTGVSTPKSIKSTPIKPKDLRVVVSKSSTSKKYHYNWCSSGKRIKIENQIWFNTEQEAINAGYTLAGNCQK